MHTWWEKYPGRLEYELKAIADSGLEFTLDDDVLRDAERILLRGSVVVGGEVVELEVLFPDLFPHFRPEIYAHGLTLNRHQNPENDNLCLLDRSPDAWTPEHTCAWLLTDRIPHLLGLFNNPVEMQKAEAPQGEPVSSYFRSLDGSAIFIPRAALELDPNDTVGSGKLFFGNDFQPHLQVRALVGELTTRSTGKKIRSIAKADPALVTRFPGHEMAFRWARLASAPQGFTGEAILEAADSVQRGFGNPPWQAVADGSIAVTGVVFPEEVQQGVYEDTWLFAVRFRQPARSDYAEGTYVVRAERLTSMDLGARVPSIAHAGDITVSQVGLGALGAPLALELARNQFGTLRLLESDFVEVAQTVRWPIGIPAAGFSKLQMVNSYIELNYPFVSVEQYAMRLGEAFVRHTRAETQIDALERFVDGSDLVIDASAEHDVQSVISDFARSSQTAQIYLSATNGARGGQITYINPNAGGCWMCWRYAQSDNADIIPDGEPSDLVQPRGCAAPTFTGTSFDLLPISAQAARVASAVTAPGSSKSSTLWLCSIEGDASAPLWTEHDVDVHPLCPFCSPK